MWRDPNLESRTEACAAVALSATRRKVPPAPRPALSPALTNATQRNATQRNVMSILERITMTRNRLLLALPACIAFQLVALPVPISGQGVYGSMDGVTRDSTSKQPVAHVRITAY